MELWYGNELIQNSEIKFAGEETSICLALQFKIDGETYYAVRREILLHETLNNGRHTALYGFPQFTVDVPDLIDTEISKAIVAFLAKHKLYLHSYSIASRRAYVSYNSDSRKCLDGLQYQPATHDALIFAKALAQTEDGVDYHEIFDMKIAGAVDSVSDDEIARAGYETAGYVSFSMTTLLREDEMPKELLNLAEFKVESGDFCHFYPAK